MGRADVIYGVTMQEFGERFRITLAGLPWRTLASAAELDQLPERTERMLDPGFLLQPAPGNVVLPSPEAGA